MVRTLLHLCLITAKCMKITSVADLNGGLYKCPLNCMSQVFIPTVMFSFCFVPSYVYEGC
jgi:hypothetical protein